MITRRTQGKSAPTRADKEEASRLQSEPSHQHSSLQPTQERPAWKSLVVTVIVTVSGTSALSDCSHKSLGLDRLQKGEDSAHQLLEGGASATTLSMCRWLRPSRGRQIGHLPLRRGHWSFLPEGRTLDSLFGGQNSLGATFLKSTQSYMGSKERPLRD